MVPEEVEVMGDVLESGGGEEVGHFLQFVTGMERDATQTVKLLTKNRDVRPHQRSVRAARRRPA